MSHYRSRQPVANKKPRRSRRGLWAIVACLVLLVVAGLFAHHVMANDPTPTPRVAVHVTKSTTTPPKTTAPTPKPVATTPCTTSTLSSVVIVSISQRHMWACDTTTVAYDSPVITGMDFLAADLTPTGTYHVTSKQTNLYLNGSDSTGSWHDYVYYWMPFLHNQYGSYGFHDATWRDPNAFGNVSPDSSDASHGCVELPLATAAWLYHWATVGTTVTIVS